MSKLASTRRQAPKAADLYVFANSTKAGTRHTDQAKIARTIERLSKNSAHFRQASEADAKTTAQVERLRAQIAALDARGATAAAARRVRFDATIASLEATRRLERTWCVVDMDQFFAAVAMRDDPSLVGKPVAVGGDAMISTANYTAREFGVRSAMPGFIARELCPALVFVRSDFAAYKVAAKHTRRVFAKYDQDFDAGSLDEASLDLTEIVATASEQREALVEEQRAAAGGALEEKEISSSVPPYQSTPLSEGEVEEDEAGVPPRQLPLPTMVVASIRAQIYARTQLTASAGIAPNRMLAKICSDEEKPDGQFVLPPTRDAVVAFMARTRLRRVPGIGRVLEKLLREAFGATHCADILSPRVGGLLLALLGEQRARWLLACALGIANDVRRAPTLVGPAGERKGMSLERTFAKITQIAPLRAKLKDFCANLANDLLTHGDPPTPSGTPSGSQATPASGASQDGAHDAVNRGGSADGSIAAAAPGENGGFALRSQPLTQAETPGGARATTTARHATSSGTAPSELGRNPLKAKRFKIIWKTTEFVRREKSCTLRRYVWKEEDIYAAVLPLFEKMCDIALPPNGPGLRLMGVGASSWEGTRSASQGSIAGWMVPVREGGANMVAATAAAPSKNSAGSHREAVDRSDGTDEVEAAEGVDDDDDDVVYDGRRSSSSAATPRPMLRSGSCGVLCPICGKRIGESGSNAMTPTTNFELNAHVDLCLNVGEIGSQHEEHGGGAGREGPTGGSGGGDGATASSSAPRGAAAASVASSSASASVFDWECEACTLRNTVAAKSCIACHTRRHLAKRARLGSRNGTKKFKGGGVKGGKRGLGGSNIATFFRPK